MADETKIELQESEEDEIITLEMDDGTTEDCYVLTVFPMDEKQYIALMPVATADQEDGDIYLYGYEEDADGNPVLIDIEDDDEFEAACDRFDEICDENEFDEGEDK